MISKHQSIDIIGSGTIGAYTGYLLGKAGYTVTLYEDHPKIGEPCHCTGIITKSFLDMVDLKKGILLNKLSKVKVVGPNSKSTILKTSDIVVDRITLDQYFTELALDHGATLKKEHKVTALDPHQETISIQNCAKSYTKNYSTLIAADGPNSKVFPLLNPTIKRKPWYGAQAVIKGKFDSDMYEAYLNNAYAKGFFAWVVPENSNTAVVGLAVHDRPSLHFEAFMKKRFGDNFKDNISSYRGGLIPMHYRQATCQKRNIFLVGDAGGHVKASTGGGIIPGMKAAQALVHSLKTGISYDKLWRKYTGFNLWAHLKIRNTLNKFSDEDYNNLIALMNKEKTKKVMAQSDREYPASFATKLLLAEPRLLQFVKHIF